MCPSTHVQDTDTQDLCGRTQIDMCPSTVAGGHSITCVCVSNVCVLRPQSLRQDTDTVISYETFVSFWWAVSYHRYTCVLVSVSSLCVAVYVLLQLRN